MEEEIEVLEEEKASTPLGGKLSAEPTDEGAADQTCLTSSVTLRVPPSPQGEGLIEKGEGFLEHIRSLANQGQRFRETVPGFDLRRELQDPMFARLTSPQVGLSVEDAYYALHRRELQQQAARVAAGSISRAIQAGQLRPRENSGVQAGSVQTLDYSKATREQREQLKTAIRNAAAKGEKIYP